jgi:hypothetical protein
LIRSNYTASEVRSLPVAGRAIAFADRATRPA